ncbi:MAG: hypothetical protein PUC47_07910 [Oscillospiraceae bacterium]|nr:hypothetical protein [Oscillospiraceae bacterium]
MRGLKSMVDSADSQRAFCRKKAAEAPHDAESAAVLARSEDICRQARENYERTRKKLWICLPAALMGFGPIKTEEETKRHDQHRLL